MFDNLDDFMEWCVAIVIGMPCVLIATIIYFIWMIIMFVFDLIVGILRLIGGNHD